MKIVVSSTGKDLKSGVDPRFGRCQFFLVVDLDSMKYSAAPNTAGGSAGGAGIEAAQMVSGMGVSAVLTGNIGPNAHRALNAAGIKVYVGATGTVSDSIERFKRGELTEAGNATVPGHFGMGGGGGQGMGRGGGGRGRGMGGGGSQ
ncbi:MAG: NifB/NifX family molybdenum-iron cluster-binding protein [Thermoplasmata archaeon]|nr:NifB/NifX family molybdenum-iron cluster-binding protein [Thermoplasmata archaeon]